MATTGLTDSLRETLHVFDSVEPRTTSDVADALDLGRRAAYARLERLVEQEEIETKKVGANARVWWRSNGPHDRSDEFGTFVDAIEEYALFTLDPGGHVRSWNPGAERIKGYTAEEIIGEHFSIFYREDDRERGVPDRNLRDARETGSIEDEGWRVRSDGSTFWAAVSITTIRDEAGEIEGYAKVTRDMTQRKEYERQLKQERDLIESELQEVFDRISDGFYSLDEDLRFRYINDQAKETLGLAESAIGEPLPSLVPTTDAFDEALREARAQQEPVVFEDYYEPVGRWFYNAIYPSETGLSVYFREITERKERERELNRAETVLETVWDGIAVLDAEERFVMVNDAFCEMIGSPREEILGESVSMILAEDDHERAKALNAQVLAGEIETEEFEYDLQTSDGQAIPVEAKFGPVEFDHGTAGIAGVVRDVRERREREETLRNTKAQLEAATQAGKIGTWQWHVPEDRMVTGGWFAKEFSVDPQAAEQGVSLEQFMQSIHEDDRSRVSDSITAALNDCGDYEEEYRVWNADGNLRWVVARGRVVCDDSGDPVAFPGALTDITDRKRAEMKLARQRKEQRALADLGQFALETDDLDELMSEACRRVADTLNQDYCSVLDLVEERDELELRAGVGWKPGIVGSATVETDERSQAGYTIQAAEAVVVEELATEDRFAGPELLTEHDVSSGISTIIGSVEAPWGVLGTHDTDSQTYPEETVHFVQNVANILATAIERHRTEQQLADQREQLAALNSLNFVVQELTDAVIDQSRREEIEETVCTHLAGSESYQLAWIGEADTREQSVEISTAAGTTDYLEDISISLDSGEATSKGPTARALETGEMQVTRDIPGEADYDPWKEQAMEYGFLSSAAIPILAEDIVYGVLNVYANRPGAFDGREGNLMAYLGEVIGHAIAATERRQALMSDELVEIELQIRGMLGDIGIEGDMEGRIEIGDTIPISDGAFLVYGTASPEAVDVLEEMSRSLSSWESLTIRSSGDPTRFELELSDPTILSAISTLGGYIDEAVIEQGDLQLRIHTAPSADVRKLLDVIRDEFPNTEILRRKQITRQPDDPRRLRREIIAELTERQRAVLDASYQSGYFEWPRESSGEEVAESLGIAPATFSQHLRRAEKSVFSVLFGEHPTSAGE